MRTFVLRRVLQVVPLLFGLTAITFLLVALAPGDFLNTLAENPAITPQVLESMRRNFGLDRPVWVQYGLYLWNLLHGDFGQSFSRHQPVFAVLREGLANTLLLAGAAAIVTWGLAIPLGVIAAVRQNTVVDRSLGVLAYVWLSVPEVLSGLLLLLFAARTGWFPTGGMHSLDFERLGPLARAGDLLHHLALPAIAVGLVPLASRMRQTRANLLDVLLDYVTTARAKGLDERTVVVSTRSATRSTRSSRCSGSRSARSSRVRSSPRSCSRGPASVASRTRRSSRRTCTSWSGRLMAACVLVAATSSPTSCSRSPTRGSAMTEPRAAAAAPAPAFWRPLRKRPLALAAGALLAAFYLAALFAPALAPYREDSMDRARFYHPPQRVHWIGPDGFGPYVFGTALDDPRRLTYREDRTVVRPLRFVVRGEPYRWLGLVAADRHLFGLEGGGRVYLLGSDAFGRDVLSRLLYGAQVSLTVGLVGIAISFALGLLLGGVSGYFGGWVDALVMRVTELLLNIPGLYLVIALRALFPASLPSGATYLAIVAILALLGWASLARIVRGMVLSLRTQDYVAAAEALGAGRLRIVTRHVLPNTMSFVIVAATVSIPGYILGEVFLSFLGVGVQEPAASWGNMLNAGRSLRVLSEFPWLVGAPAVAIFLTVMAYNLLGDGLRDALDPRRTTGGTAG